MCSLDVAGIGDVDDETVFTAVGDSRSKAIATSDEILLRNFGLGVMLLVDDDLTVLAALTL